MEMLSAVFTSLILLLCLLQIRRLKKTIAQEARRRLLPQLNLELILGTGQQDMGLYLKNENFFLAKDIKIEDVEMALEDSGFKVNVILKFEGIDYLKPQESVRLSLKVFNNKRDFLPEATEKIIPHLVSPSFKVKIYYSNIENLRFLALFLKKREKFSIEKVESLI